MRELDETLTGLEPVKSHIRETAALLLGDKAAASWGWLSKRPCCICS